MKKKNLEESINYEKCNALTGIICNHVINKIVTVV